MSKADFTAAIEARLPLRAMEDEIDAAIAGSAKLTIAMLEARKAAGLPLRDGHALIYKNMEIGMVLADARAQAVKLHAGSGVRAATRSADHVWRPMGLRPDRHGEARPESFAGGRNAPGFRRGLTRGRGR